MAHSAITHDPIEPTEVLASLGSDEDGAVLLFLGTVRNHAEGRDVTGILYEAYQEMAEKELAAIAEEAAVRAGTPRVAVIHRLGELAVGEPSVAIGVASPHRAEAYDASRFVIEEIKKRLPVWKKERFVDGSADWTDGTRPQAAAPPARESAS